MVHLLLATPEVSIVGGTSNPAGQGADDEEGGFTETNNRDAEAEQRRKKRQEKVHTPCNCIVFKH